MKKIKSVLKLIFIDGLSGMALGLFATLIVGTIVGQIASYIGGSFGSWLSSVASVFKAMTGAGIGVGVACKFKKPPLVVISAAAVGMVGAFASAILKGTLLEGGKVLLSGPGEPLGAFIAVICAVGVGSLVANKTKLDILVTPLTMLVAGSAAGLLLGPPISALMTALGDFINWGTEQQPLVMGIVVSVVMGLCLTLPISSAAIGISLGLSGIAAGAAVVGCCCQMVGFAVSSYRENKLGGLFAQGIGTSMLQMPNIVRHPLIWIPPTLASAILGPVATLLVKLPCNAIGSGMGTAGLVGPIMTYTEMANAGEPVWYSLLIIAVMLIIVPAALSLTFSEIMRKLGWIKKDDMLLEI